jgi:hypothetical protein
LASATSPFYLNPPPTAGSHARRTTCSPRNPSALTPWSSSPLRNRDEPGRSAIRGS